MIDVEATMVRAAVRVGLPALALATLLAGAVRGIGGALTAAGVVALVLADFVVTGRTLGWGARRGLATLQAVALGGFVIRMAILGLLIAVLHGNTAVDVPVLAVAGAAAVVALLAYEARFVLRTPQLHWLTTGDRR